jgi:hypothetical protein
MYACNITNYFLPFCGKPISQLCAGDILSEKENLNLLPPLL